MKKFKKLNFLIIIAIVAIAVLAWKSVNQSATLTPFFPSSPSGPVYAVMDASTTLGAVSFDNNPYAISEMGLEANFAH